MKAEEIRDRETLEAWLRERPRRDAVVIAHRAALRVLPIWGAAMGEDWARKRDLTALPILRCSLITAVAGTWPTADIREEAARAAAANAADAAAYAARAAAAANADAAAAAAYAANAADAARAAAAVLEREEDVLALELWPGNTPDWFGGAEAKMLAIWDDDPSERWAFWRRWWEGAKNGQPLDPELQLAIVKGIDDETWKDPDRVAARVVEIEARFHLDQVIADNPHAWRIELDPKTGRFTAHAVERRDLSEIVAGIRETIKDFHRRCKLLNVGNFGQSVQLAFKPVIDTLRRDLRRHQEEPFSLFKTLEYARAELEEIAETEQFAGESYVSRFFKTLDDHAEDICLAAPEVVEQLKAKAAVRYELCSIERRMSMMRQTFGLHLDAEGILKRAALEALIVLQDEDASEERKKDAFYFCTAILPRAARAYLAEKEETGEAPDAPQSTKLKRAVEAADTLSKLDKGKDALVENVPQMYEGVQSLLEYIGNNPWPF